MVALPKNEVTMEDISHWNDLQEKLKKLKAEEMLMRMKIYNGLFAATAVEGTNSMDLHAGWKLKAQRKIDRKVDIPVLQAFIHKPDANTPSKFEEAGLNMDDLIEWKPELKLRAYRALSEAQVAVFDQVLSIKDGSPSMEIVLPASARNQA